MGLAQWEHFQETAPFSKGNNKCLVLSSRVSARGHTVSRMPLVSRQHGTGGNDFIWTAQLSGRGQLLDLEIGLAWEVLCKGFSSKVLREGSSLCRIRHGGGGAVGEGPAMPLVPQVDTDTELWGWLLGNQSSSARHYFSVGIVLWKFQLSLWHNKDLFPSTAEFEVFT